MSLKLILNNGISIKLCTMNLGRPIEYIVKGQQFQNIVFLSLQIDFVSVNLADLDEMPLYAAFHLGLHCLPKYPFRDFWSIRPTLKNCWFAVYGPRKLEVGRSVGFFFFLIVEVGRSVGFF